MTDYNAPPGSEDYATRFWSSPEGRARAAAERAASAPRTPSRVDVIRDKLAAHDAALAASYGSRHGLTGRPGYLPAAEVESLQAELYAALGDPVSDPPESRSAGPEADQWSRWVGEMAGAE